MPDEPRARVGVLAWLLATLFYCSFAILETWPLATHLTTVIPSDLGDPLLNTWIVWWNAHAMPFTAAWWNAPAFWPSSDALAFSEVLVGLSPITTPIQWLGGSPVAAYGVAFLLTFPLSALAAHALAHRLTGRHDAAVVAGLVFGFNPYRISQLPHIQVLASFWMPVILLGLHQYLSRRRRRWLILFGTAWLMQALSNDYYLLFFPVLLVMWMVWFALSRSNARTAMHVMAAWVIASLPLIPLLWTYRRIHAVYGFHRDLGEVDKFSADMAGWLGASPLMRFWTPWSFRGNEGNLFPGLAAAILVLLLVLHVIWQSRRALRISRGTVALLLASVALVVVVIGGAALGPRPIVVGKMTLASIAVMVCAGAVALRPEFPAAWHRRSPLLFYALATGLIYLLAFGPSPHLLGVPLGVPGPYRLLMLSPGYDSVRVPARFAMLAVLCLSIVAALAFARLTWQASLRCRRLAAGVFICGILADSAITGLPLEALPSRVPALEALPGRAPVVELPLGDGGDDLQAMYRGMYHRHPVVNGYSGFFPPSYDVLRRGLAIHDPKVFDALTALGPLVVAIDTSRDVDGLWASQVAAQSGAVLVGEAPDHKMFSLPGAAPPAGVTPLTRRRLQ